MDLTYSVTIISHYRMKYEDVVVGEVILETDLREKTPWVDLRNVSSTKGEVTLPAGEATRIGKNIEEHLLETKGYTRVDLITASAE